MAQQSPPNVQEFIDRIKPHSRNIIIVVVLAVLGYSSFFSVGAEEVGVITRFGKFSRTVEPGLNFNIPFMEKVQKVAVERQQKQEFGFRTTKAGVQTEYTRDGVGGESLMLTGDLNLADVEWVVQYRIDDPYNFLFKVRNPETTLRDISEAAMRQIVGDRTVNEVLTVGRTEIATRVEELMQELCREYSLGIKVEQVVL